MPRLAVIGYPVAHSRSPAMQTAALQALGLEGWSYEAVEVAPDGFEARVREMATEGFAGANVTIPHKEAALALADFPSAAAREIGAANTLSFGVAGDGPDAESGIAADNTDAGGLLAALAGCGAEPPRGRALVLGAGGAARAAIWALANAGAGAGGELERFEVDVWNRTRSRAEAVCAALGGAEALGSAVVDAPALAEYAVVVNTTAVGLHGEDPFAELPLSREGFAPGQVVVDMVYGERPSALLAAAAERGAATVDGLEVLVRQGALSLEIWTGREAPLEVMRAAARASTTL